MPLSFFSNSGNSYGSSIPFQRIVEPAQLGFFLNLEQSELLRIQRYNEGWRFYFGRHWLFKREDGEPLVTFNYFRKIIDKSVAFLTAKGFHIKTPESLEEVSKPFLDEVWEYNKREQVTVDIATIGAVTGDAFVLVTFEEATVMQKKINPFSQGQIRLNLLGSEQVYPTWDPLNTDTLIAVRIETIYYAERGSRQLDREDRVNHEGRQLYTKRFTQIITPDQIVEQFHGDMPIVRPNLLGEIPIVHIKNLALPKEYYGLPDGIDIVDLQRELNEKATDISDSINYHCVDEETEALTKSGWKKYHELREYDQVLGLDPVTDEIVWQPIERVNVYDYDGMLTQWDNRVDALTTPNHRWLAEKKVGRTENLRYERQFVRTSEGEGAEPRASDLREGSRIILGGGVPAHFPAKAKYDDELVETIGWLVTEGCIINNASGSKHVQLSQPESANAEFVGIIRRIQAYWRSKGEKFTEQTVRDNGVVCWMLGVDLSAALLDVAPNKQITPEFLTSLTHTQARLLFEVLMDADGTWPRSWYQDDENRVASFQMLVAMLEGGRTAALKNNRGDGVTYVHQTRTIEILATVNRAVEVHYTGKVWCPTTRTGTWFARRGGYTYWTGNSAPVTVIYGAKAKQLERGPRQIWAGLPKDARVETLKLEGDLTAANNYWDKVKKGIMEISDIPEGSLGSMQPISNTSGVALHLQYQPLIEKTKRKRIQYEPGFEQVNYFILRIGMVKGLINLPFDLCKKCGGRIVEIQTGETTKVWNTQSQAFEDKAIRKKRCYHVDKQTLEFTDPFQMRMKFWRKYGFGDELRDMTYEQIIREIETQKDSFWDYGVLQNELLKRWTEKNTDKINEVKAQADLLNAPAPQTDPETGEEIPNPPSQPDQSTLPKPPTPPGILVVRPLPDGEIDIPEEPEAVTIVRTWINPDTQEVAFSDTIEKFLVPTDCKVPQYLNPFETKVEFLDVLPKDEALQAQLYQQYLTMGLVDAEWVQDRIPEIAHDAAAIRKRMKAMKIRDQKMEPLQALKSPMGETQVLAKSQTPPGNQLAPKPQDQATVPGQGGNPVAQGEQLTMASNGDTYTLTNGGAILGTDASDPNTSEPADTRVFKLTSSKPNPMTDGVWIAAKGGTPTITIWVYVDGLAKWFPLLLTGATASFSPAVDVLKTYGLASFPLLKKAFIQVTTPNGCTGISIGVTQQ